MISHFLVTTGFTCPYKDVFWDQIRKTKPLLAHYWVLQDFSLILADRKYVTLVFWNFYHKLTIDTGCSCAEKTILEARCSHIYEFLLSFHWHGMLARWVKSTNHCRWKGSVHIAAWIPIFHHFEAKTGCFLWKDRFAPQSLKIALLNNLVSLLK